MKSVRLILINVLVLSGTIGFLEMALRTAWTARSCFVGTCDFGRLAFGKVRSFPESNSEVSASLRFHDELGYVPRAEFDATLNTSLWPNKQLTITADGFRDNGARIARSNDDILVVGDSYTFGEQVGNDETWPACLQRMLNRRVDNGGVTGYGAAQALRRATVEMGERRYADIVLSIVVGDDFARDRMIYKWGRPKPAVVSSDQGLGWSKVGDPTLEGTIFNPKIPSPVTVALYENLMIFAMVVDKIAPQIAYPWVAFEREHPDAAPVEAIIPWTLNKFVDAAGERAVLLLQYWQYLDNEHMLQERANIRELAEQLPIRLIDTYEALREEDSADVWNGHHTPYGNQLVCRELAERAF